jgi:predicted dehydrogenase
VGVVGFNYRQVPAVQRARTLIEAGAIGTPTHARFQLLTDYAADPASPLSWRFTLEHGGHGVLGDLASHGVDLVRFLLGDITALVARTGISIPRRPIVDAVGHYTVVDLDQPGLTFGDVENEDSVTAMLELASGVTGTLVCDRAAVGEQNSYGFDIHGTAGTLRWDFRRPGELHVAQGAGPARASSARELSAPGDGEYAAFQPGAGIAMGYDDTKVIEGLAFVRAIAGRPAEGATLDDALASARALDAMVRSAESGAWIRL